MGNSELRSATEKIMKSRIVHPKVDADLLSKARIDAGYSMADVVVALNDGCNKSSVQRWEMGKLNPSPERVKKMVKLFKRWDFVIENNGADDGTEG